ncbi:MAG: hypothetical protein ABSH53_23380 [Holophaga sp.]|jgi:hypothetical protein
MSRIRTYSEIAADFDLWMAYADPHPDLTREAFDALSLEEKVMRQIAAFGPEAERTLPEGLTEESARFAWNGPRDQQIRDFERILSRLDGWETASARELRRQTEDGLAELTGWTGHRQMPG